MEVAEKIVDIKPNPVTDTSDSSSKQNQHMLDSVDETPVDLFSPEHGVDHQFSSCYVDKDHGQKQEYSVAIETADAVLNSSHVINVKSASDANGKDLWKRQHVERRVFETTGDLLSTGQGKSNNMLKIQEGQGRIVETSVKSEPSGQCNDIKSDLNDKDQEQTHQKSVSVVETAGDGDSDEAVERKQAWVEPHSAESVFKRSGKTESEEEKIRRLLIYMEEEKRKLAQENGRIVTGTGLEDIQEADEESIRLSVDSRPNSQQILCRPVSARSRPPSARSRPPSARSRSTGGFERMNGSMEDSEMMDPLNTIKDETWYLPVRPPSVMDKNLAAGITLESGGKYKISLPSDTEKCAISSVAFLESGDLVLTDMGNQKVKYVDQKFKFISQIPMAEPCGVCAVGNDIYVTNSTNTIQHLFVKDMVLEMGKTFDMNGKCYGIANFNNGIAVGLKSSEIQLMNTLGEVKRIIKIPKTEKGKLICPRHLSVTPKFDILVTDSEAKIVYCLDSKGELLFRYQNMSNPHATVSDSDGNIFLVGLNKETNLIMQILRKTGECATCVKSVLQMQDVEFEPRSICFRKSDGLLVLAGIRHAIKRYRIM